MSRQQIAIDWKIKETLFDPKTHTFPVKVTKLGRYTAATAAEKMIKKFPGYRFNPKPFHGFGGYWVDGDGNTAECLPA